MKKSIIFMHLLLIMLIAGFIIPSASTHVEASSISSKTKKAKKLYKKKLKKIYESSIEYSYLIKNIYGDKVPELIVDYLPSGERHGIGKIYTYKNGKIKSILKAGSDNMELDVYKKSKSIIVKTSYHDYEASEYYTYKNGRYRLKATKCYNSMVPRKWYENADEKEISKSEFKKKTKGIVKGKKTKIEHTDLKYCTGYYGY